MANIEFHYFGEEKEASENADIDDMVDSEPRTTRINSAGQKIRGKDLNWRSKMKFSSAQPYHGYPVVVVGCTSTSGKLFASLTALTSHEDSKTWKEIYWI